MAWRRRPQATPIVGPRVDADHRCTSIAITTGHQCSRRRRPGLEHCYTHLPAQVRRRTPAVDSLAASVAQVQLDGVAWQTWRFGSTAWQAEGWRLYDITGQLRFVANWVGNSVSRCRLYVAEVDDAGEPGDAAADPDVAALAAGPLGQGPAKDEALRLLGINLFVPGEAYIIAEADAGSDGDDLWYVVSGRQIRRLGNDIVIRRSQLVGGGDMIYREGVDLILRVWTPHPADTDEPDSPTRSAIPDLRELEAIRKREFAELDSRLTGAGLLPLPEGIAFPHLEGDPPGVDSFTKMLTRYMGTSLQDRSSAEAMVPIAFTVPGEFIDKIKQVTFWSELSAQLLPMRQAAVVSLAQSLDIPAEILLGQADSNHWSAWMISEDAISTQIVPVLSRIAEALTTGYLQAALKRMGRDPNAYVYAFDVAPLTTRLNRAADALNYHQEGLISDEAAVEAGAFRPDQMPTGTERLRRLAEKLVLANPALLADAIVRDLVGLGPVPPPLPIPAPPAVPEPAGPQPAPAPATNPESPPTETPQTEAALLAVCNLATVRAMGLAGSRLVPHNQRDRWPGTSRHDLHTKVGPIGRAEADRALRGAWDDLALVAGDLGVDADQLRHLLHGFATELLTRGMAYDRTLLADLVNAAVRGRRLSAPVMVGAAA